MLRCAVRAALLTAALSLWSVAGATIVYVDQSGGGDYATIHEALAAAVSGDEILVAPGTYDNGPGSQLEFGDRIITLRSLVGRDHTTIDAAGSGGCVVVNAPYAYGTSRIEGFTIRGGHARYGGGIRVDNCSLDIAGCSFEDCVAQIGDHHWSDGKGGGLYCDRATVSVTDCTFVGNEALERGAGIYCEESYLTVSACTFENNGYDYGSRCDGVAIATVGYTAEISDCEFVGNQGGDGAAVRGWGFVQMQNCSLARNSSEDGSALTIGIGIIERCIIAFTDPGQGVSCDQRTTFTNCVVFGNAAGDSICGNSSDNLLADPLMCEPEAGDLGLCSDSPCLPQGNDWGMLVGARGQECGQCGTPVETRSWTSIKALYR